MENNPFFDLYIDEAASFSIFVDVYEITYDEATGEEKHSPIDLSSINNVEAVIRANYLDSSPILATFSCSITEPKLGEIGMALTSNDTTGLYDGPDPVHHLGYYDIITTNALGTRVKLVGGKVYLNQTVTLL